MALSDSGASSSSSGSSTSGVRSDTASPPPLPKVPISGGEANVSKGGGVDEWLEMAKKCKFLPEADMKRLCELVKEYLMEGKLRALLVGMMHWRIANMRFTSPIRKQYTTCENTSHRVRRYPWSILRLDRAISSGWRLP